METCQANGCGSRARTSGFGGPGRIRRLRGAIFGWLLLAATSVFFLSGRILCAQSADTQGGANESWTDTSALHSDNANPTRTVESHSQSGNRTVDNQSTQREGPDGNFEPYQDIEKTTEKVDSTTTKTITREYGRDADGARTLVQVSEEETHTRPAGGSYTVRSTSNPDVNGDLELVQREIEETRKIGKNEEETKTTVMLPGAEGGLAPALMREEHSTKEGNDTVQSQTTLLPDGNGGWQVSEVKQSTTHQEGNSHTTDEQISRPDADGKLSEVSRTVSKESASGANKRDTVETYSLDVPGVARDGNLHVVEEATTVQNTNSNGEQNTRHVVARPDPGDPEAGLQVYVVSTDRVNARVSGALATRTIQTRDADGNLDVVSVDTSKSDNIHAVQVQIAPSAKAK